MDAQELFGSDFKVRRLMIDAQEVTLFEKRFLYIHYPHRFVDQHAKSVAESGGALFTNYDSGSSAPIPTTDHDQLYDIVSFIEKIGRAELIRVIPQSDFAKNLPADAILEAQAIVGGIMNVANAAIVAMSDFGLHVKVFEYPEKTKLLEQIDLAHEFSERYFSPGFSRAGTRNIAIKNKRILLGHGG